jgi:hypothetical protein
LGNKCNILVERLKRLWQVNYANFKIYSINDGIYICKNKNDTLMKKIIITACMLVGILLNSQAQRISKNAIGLRLSEFDGLGIAASYQHGLQNNHRIELDLGVWNHNYHRDGVYYDSQTVKVVGLFQWVLPIQNRFNWYVGVGGGAGTFNNKEDNDYPDNGAFGLVAGDIGVEYSFKFPLQLFIDVRPEVGFGDYRYTNRGYNNFGPDIGTGARFRF